MAKKKRSGSRGQSPSATAMNEALRRRKASGNVQTKNGTDSEPAGPKLDTTVVDEALKNAIKLDTTMKTETKTSEAKPSKETNPSTDGKTEKANAAGKTTVKKPKKDTKTSNGSSSKESSKSGVVPGDPVASQYAMSASAGKTEQRIGIAVVAVLLLIIGTIIGAITYSNHKKAQDEQKKVATAETDLSKVKVKPSNITSDGAFDIVKGKVINPKTESNYSNLVKVDVYMDFNCPGCGDAERTLGDTYNEMLAANKIMLRLHPIAFLNNTSTDKYSERAANAVMQVGEQDPDNLISYIQYLMQSGVQPKEGSEYVSVTDKMLQQHAKAAGVKVKDYSTITNGKYDTYVKAITNYTTTRKKLIRPNVSTFTTPIIMVNGRHLTFETDSLITEFTNTVNTAAKTMKAEAIK